MVAREGGRTSFTGRVGEGLLLAWRRALTRGLSAARAGVDGGAEAVRTAPATAFVWASDVVSATRSPARRLPTALAPVTIAAVALATATSLALGTLGDGTGMGALLFAAESAAWALFRLIVITVLASEGRRSARRASFSAWGVGLSPYVLGATPTLRAAAFIASAFLTYRLLLRHGERSSARLAVVVAFGGQALAALAAWVVLNGLLYAVPLGR